MLAFQSLSLFLLLCVHIKLTISTYTLSGNILTDLTETTPGSFGAGWTASSLVTNSVMTSFCDGLLLIGGYNVLGGALGEYFTASYSGLPTHNVIYYSLVFWAIDSWDPPEGDRANLQFDTTVLYGWSYPSIPPGSGNLCGGSYGEVPNIILKGQVAHSNPTLEFRVVSGLYQLTDDESFGFRELRLEFATTTTTPIVNSMCAITPIQMPTTQPATSYATAPVNTCPCSTTEYENPTRTGHCYPCHTDCLTCTLSGSTACTSCQPGKYLSGTQCEPCSTYCATCNLGGSNNCLSCSTGSFLVLGTSCVSSCTYPLVPVTGTAGSPDTCTSPCTNPTDFIYWDQSCDSSCPSLLYQENIAGLKLCKYQCATNEFLYWDGTCQSACNLPLSATVQKSRNFCNFPCSTSQYLQWDGTCQSTCPYYFQAITQNGLRYCNRRCSSGQYYAPWSSSCISSCNPPFRVQGYVCNLPCDDPLDYYYPSNRTCLSECSRPFQVNTGSSYLICEYPELDSFMANLFLLAPEQDGTPTLVVLVRIMQYVRYLNVSMPPRLERLVLSKGRNIMSLNFGFSMPSGMRDDFVTNPISSIFKKHGLHSQFFVNFWKDFIWFSILLVVAVLFHGFEILSNRSDWKLLESLFRAFRILTKWNLLIIVFATSIDDVILFSSIEFMSFYISIDTALEYVSFITCLVIIGLMIALILFIFCTLAYKSPRKLQGDAEFSDKAIKFSTQNQFCGVFYLGLNIQSAFGKYFFLIYMARLGVPMILTMALSNSQIINVFAQIFTTLAMLGCLISFRPIKNRFNHFQLVIFELITFLMNSGIAVITVFDVYQIDAWNASIVLGDIVIVGNSITNLLVIVFVIFKVCSELSSVSKIFRSKSFQEQLIFFVQLLVIPMQQGGMGFECIFGTYGEHAAPTELGNEAYMLGKKSNPTVGIEPIRSNQIPRLVGTKGRTAELDRSDLKSRLSRTSNMRIALDGILPHSASNESFDVKTNLSRLSTPFDSSSVHFRSHLNIKELNSSNIDAGELPSSSSLDNSFIPLGHKKSDQSLFLNNISYDFGDTSVLGDINTPNRFARISSSTYLTPSAFGQKSLNTDDDDKASQTSNKKRKSD